MNLVLYPNISVKSNLHALPVKSEAQLGTVDNAVQFLVNKSVGTIVFPFRFEILVNDFEDFHFNHLISSLSCFLGKYVGDNFVSKIS